MHLKESIAISKALADSSRLMILNGLMEKPQYVEELSKRFDLAASTVSFHLKKLMQARLVFSRREQYYTVYHINTDILNKSIKELITFKRIDQMIEEERMEKYRNKVLATFMPDEQVIRMPAQHKKRLIIYNYFLNKFETGRQYTEQEVNEMILPHYEDYCYIRRALIDEGMMKRKGQMYWRETESR